MLWACGLAAVVAANIVIYFYVKMAWNEEDMQQKIVPLPADKKYNTKVGKID